MKKKITGTLLLGSILLGASIGMVAQAADTLNGSTEIGAEITRGDVILSIDSPTNFGSQPLSAIVDFGSKEIKYTVTDYSGLTNGFTISAKLTDTDEKRSLKIGEAELSETTAPVIKKTTNTVGENKDKVTSSLTYTGVTKTQNYTSTIEWNLSKVDTKQISE